MIARRSTVELFAVIRKEVRQTVRDRRIMFMLVAAPLLQTIALGSAGHRAERKPIEGGFPASENPSV